MNSNFDLKSIYCSALIGSIVCSFFSRYEMNIKLRHSQLKGNERSWSDWLWLKSAVTHLLVVFSSHFTTAPGCAAHVFVFTKWPKQDEHTYLWRRAQTCVCAHTAEDRACCVDSHGKVHDDCNMSRQTAPSSVSRCKAARPLTTSHNSIQPWSHISWS